MTNWNWKQALISPNTPIKEVWKSIDTAGLQIAIVVDETEKILGTVTDGDIRRGILRGANLDSPIHQIMNRTPTLALETMPKQKMLKIMKDKGFLQMPIVDVSGRVIGIETLEDMLRNREHRNLVVLMAGGQGKRLLPLTKDCPKPLLRVGDKPILEIILESFISQGFRNFTLSVNYKAEMLVDYFRDGSKWGCQIDYLKEERDLGTAGSLSLLKNKPTEPILVMNADLLTKVNFEHLLDFHQQQEAEATMCVREYDHQVPYGVVSLADSAIQSIEEKPVYTFFVSGGIYVLEPQVLGLVPSDTAFDMPQLFEKLIVEKRRTSAFPVREYWLDIGRADDFERATGDVSGLFQGRDK